MKKFKVRLVYKSVIVQEVEAETENEAFAQAAESAGGQIEVAASLVDWNTEEAK